MTTTRSGNPAPPPPATAASADDLAIAIMSTTSRVTRHLRRAVGGHESGATWRVLSILGKAGPMRVTALAEADALTQPSATSLVNRLVSAGLVERMPDPHDGRACLVGLTDQGRDQLQAYFDHAAEVMRPGIARLTADEQATVRAAMTIFDRLLATTPSDEDSTSVQR